MLWIIPEKAQAAVVMEAKAGLKQPLLEIHLTLNPIIEISNIGKTFTAAAGWPDMTVIFCPPFTRVVEYVRTKSIVFSSYTTPKYLHPHNLLPLTPHNR
jgi:hypothetical protein